MKSFEKEMQAVPDQNGQPAVPVQCHESKQQQLPAEEINGPKGLEPTRYGDWERKGRCVDF